MLFGYTVLLPAGAGIVLGILGFVVSRYREQDFTEHAIEMALFALSGFLIAASVLIDPRMAGLLHTFRTLNLFGVNIMLAVMVWSGMITWYEAVRKETFEASAHYIRTPLAVWVFAFSLPLWSLDGLRPGGIGLILGVAAIIVARKMGTEGRKVAPFLAAAAAALGGVQIGAWVGGYRTMDFMGVSILLAIILVFGTLTIFTVIRNRKYHPLRGPLYAAITVAAIAVAIGSPFYNVVDGGAAHGATTVAKIARPGDDGNPFDPIARAVAAAIEARAARR